MKNHFSFILAALAIASLSGCVNVSTDVQTYYPSLSPTSVVVLENKERLPEEAEPIGTLKTSKYGNDCHHESLLRKAIMATAASGGNILRISSAPEDSCHEINGVIARMPEGSAVPYDITVPHPALRYEGESKNDNYKRALGVSPRQTIRFSVGPAWITSKMYTSIYGDYIKNKMGVELAADGEFFGKSKLGFAFSFRGNNTSYGGRIGSISVFNIGLNVAYSTMLSQRWRFTYAFGPGAGFFVNSEGSKMGFNIMGRMSAEYMLTPTFGIGADMIGSTLWLGKPKGVEMPDGESYGVARAGVMIGARLYY